MPKTFREQLEEIIVRDRTRSFDGHVWEPQYVADEIEQAVRQLIERAKPTPKPEPSFWYSQRRKALDEYHSNLLAEINGQPDQET